jgi:hypothetical protein
MVATLKSKHKDVRWSFCGDELSDKEWMNANGCSE